MLLKSKPRGPFGPLTDFSCQNVFYMPQQMKKSMNKVANKRPSSAPLKSRNARSGSHHRVLPSTPTKKPLELTKVISKYHERCMPSHWIPAPGKTSQGKCSIVLCIACFMQMYFVVFRSKRSQEEIGRPTT